MHESRRPRTLVALRWLARGGIVVAATAVFLLALVLGLLVHLNSGPARRVACRALNALLASALTGRVEIEAIESLSPRLIDLAAVRVHAPDGAQVLVAEGLRLRLHGVQLLRRVLARRDELRLRFEHLRIERIELRLQESPRGTLSLIEAFEPRAPSEPADEPAAPPTPPRPVIWSLPTIELGSVLAKGTLPEHQPAPLPVDAELRRLRASLEVGPGRQLRIDVARTGVVERAILGTALTGSLGYHLRTEPLRTWGDFAGHVGQLEILAKGLLDAGEMAVDVTLPRVDPDDLGQWVPGHPVRIPFVGELHIGGQPPLFDLDARFRFPRMPGAERRGELRAQGRLHATAPGIVDLRVTASDVDTRALGAESWPATVDATARLLGRIEGIDSQLRLAFGASGSELGGRPVPHVEGTVVVDRHRAAAWLRTTDSVGSRADLTARYAGADSLALAVRANLPKLQAQPHLRALWAARFGVSAPRGGALVRARALWRGEEVQADFEAQLRHLSWPPGQLRLTAASVQGRVHGRPDDLVLDTTVLRGRGVEVAGQKLEQVQLETRGPLRRPQLEARATDGSGRQLEAKAVLLPERGALQDVRLRLVQDDQEIVGQASRISTRGGAWSVDGIRIEGVGATPVEGQLQVRGRDLVGRLKAENIEIDTIRRLLGLPYPLRGTADLDVDIRRGPTGRQGHVRLRLEDGGMLVVNGVSAELDATFDGQQVRGKAAATLTIPEDEAAPVSAADGPQELCGGTIALVRLDEVEGSLDGPLLDPQTYRAATGQGIVRGDKLRLSCLGQIAAMMFYTGKQAPLQRLGGLLDFTAELAREAGAFPTLRGLELATKGLEVVAQPEAGSEQPAWLSDRLDLEVQASADGATGQSHLHLELLDPGRLAQLDAEAQLDWEALWKGGAGAVESLRDAPISVRLSTPRRSFEALTALPQPWREQLPPLRGQLQLQGRLTGSLQQPAAQLRVQGWNVDYAPPPPRQPAGGATAAAPGERADGVPDAVGQGDPLAPWLIPVDLDLSASYRDGNAELDGRVDHQGHTVASMAARARGPLPAWLGGERAASAGWTGAASLELHDLPLESFEGLRRHRVRGKLSGHAAVLGLGVAPSPRLDLSIADLSIGESAAFDQAELRLRPAEAVARGPLLFDARLRARGGGSLQASAYGGVGWAFGWQPSPNVGEPADLYVRASAFPLETLHPLVSPAVSRLEGRLDGDLRLQWRQIATPDEVDLTADMRVSRGVVHVPQLGQELTGVQARIRTAPGGLLRVQDLVATAASGRAEGWLTARLDGLSLVDVSGELSVAEGEEVPLTVEGVPLGTASGRLVLQATRDDDEVRVILTTEDMKIALPPSASHAVQPLAEHPDVALSHRLGPAKKQRTSNDLRWTVTLALLETEVQSPSLRLLFSSNPDRPPQLRLGPETTLSGEVLLQSGEFDFLGFGSGLKLFELDRGLVRFRNEDPGNPYVNLEAHHNATDGSLIYLEYAGILRPITRDKINFRSSPPRTEEEILALLLFGDAAAAERAGGSAPSDPNAGRTGAGERSGNLAAYQLNAVLGGITSLRGLSTSLGTTEEGFTSTSVTYQVTDRLTASAAYETRAGASDGEQEAEGTAESAGDANRTRLGVEWRFYQNWLLRGSVGFGDEASSGVDLFWQYRY